MFQLFHNFLRTIALCQFTLQIFKFLQPKFLRQGTIYLLLEFKISLEQLNQLTAYVEILFLKVAEYKPNDMVLNP